ncbi:DEAD/H associated family protein [Asticcacaulis biprosthecium C19]|uniref:DEAD/H associated family protein n=1 Tax=Asticcacaulis biprosthecium C19 TaxID=715226 RepID=F4QPG3_9CAUL|nr:ligase-associated DNA damage response DEXH box helicase [Asticcacaulis biprosthecium]EGF91221.1 DEAD/H associated family protein [Asticcacaulis biprosthecium C19]
MAAIPSHFRQWFDQQDWKILPHQKAMAERYRQGLSTLLTAPTGTGKTLAGFIGSLIDIDARRPKGLHTLYISPLKALNYDIERNVVALVKALNLPVTLESRTGDTSAYRRKRQRAKPPHILLTTPESLMLLLSYPDAAEMFGSIEAVIIDEIHQVAASKRGDLIALALAQLEAYRPGYRRIGLSATVAEPDLFSMWLGPTGAPVPHLDSPGGKPPKVHILKTMEAIPYGGFMAKYAVPEIMAEIVKAKTTIVFVNTRAQAELLFQLLWEANDEALAIAIYHASLTRELRAKTQAMMAEGKLRAVVATAAIELGIDWGNVDVVIQVGAPKGVSRLLQRIGRSNHQVDVPSKAFLVPANQFEVLECEAAISAIAARHLDGDEPLPGAQDVVIQFIMNAACSAPITPHGLHDIVARSWSYHHLKYEQFEELFQFVIDGGYALRAYDRWHRLVKRDGAWVPSTPQMIQRHRQNIGVIIEAGKLKVRKIHGRGGRYLGEIEEQFGQSLSPGDTFYFGGEVLAFERIQDMTLHARASTAKEPRIPTYSGGQMPLSTFLADGVRGLLQDEDALNGLPKLVRNWLMLQARFSQLPDRKSLLVESFPRGMLFATVLYTFEGRRANQTLGMLFSRRMERLGLHPLSFTVTDYGLAITSVKAVTGESIYELLRADILSDELEEWLSESPMLKRSFRRVATIAGLVEQNHNSARKTLKQVTFSTDLIYDVLRKYDPGHVLLALTRADAERELLDLDRLTDMILNFQSHIEFRALPRPSPMSLPVILDVRTERLPGGGLEALLAQGDVETQAERMMAEVEHGLMA